jgi:hypothetical protein
MSMIRVDDLAGLICALALRPPPGSAGASYHANHPEPVTVRDAGEALHRRLGIALPSGAISHEQAVRQLPEGIRQRHLDLVGLDHWYASRRVWTLTGNRPGRPFPDDLAEAPAWYPDLARTPEP